MHVRSMRGTGVLVAIVLLGTIAGCSSASTASTVVRPVSAEVAESWLSRTMDVLAPCQTDSVAVGTALRSTPAGGGSTDLAVMLAAGQAVEDCTALTEDPQIVAAWQDVRAAFPAATSLLEQWLDATVVVDRAALEAAATNLDDRRMVTRVYDGARLADELAAAFEAEILSLAADLGIDPPAVPFLLRWNAPAH